MNNNSTNQNTTINISKAHYKQLKTLSKRFGVSNLQFINAAVNFLRTSGVNPLDKNIGAAEQFKRLEKRNDEILRFFRVFESQKLQPILDNLIITQKILEDKTNNLPTNHSLDKVEEKLTKVIKDGVAYNHKGEKANFLYIKKLETILVELNHKQDKQQKLINSLFNALKNRSITGKFSDVDIKKFEDACN